MTQETPPEPSSPSYVLVVDDDDLIRRVLRHWLTAWGYVAKEAANATEALELMLIEPATIALIDIRMPGHDGLWLAERIHTRWRQTAIIMTTGVDDIETVEKSRRLGAVDYVTKPFGRELFRQALLRADEYAREA